MKTTELSSLRVAEDISELVGETPVLHLRKMVPPNVADIYVKLEYLNPGGSIKDRAALGMILRAEREGILKPGSTILEATAGNTGVGLALIGVSRGYKVILAVPEKFSKEKAMLMEALGGVVHRTPDAEGMEGAIRLVKKLRDEIPGSWLAGQFENQANPDYHYETTARELWEQMGGKIDALVLGAGTAGTFTGIARFLKERSPETHCVLVESQASVYGGGKSGPHAVEGIGASFIPATFDRNVCDEVISVSDRDAFATIKDLAAKEGVLAGSSAGAAIFGALTIAKRLGAGKRIASIIPDSAERYLSKDPFHFNETAESKQPKVPNG
jgi:cysteine synthase A